MAAIFFDIDGTLWDKENHIPQSTKDAIRQLRKNGHQTFLCSGRTRIFINSEEKWTLAMGLAQFQGTYVSQWNQMMAGALISMLPILLVYIFAQKYFVQGIVMSGIKG